MAREFWIEEGRRWREVGIEQGGEACLTRENAGCFGRERRGEDEGEKAVGGSGLERSGRLDERKGWGWRGRGPLGRPRGCPRGPGRKPTPGWNLG